MSLVSRANQYIDDERQSAFWDKYGEQGLQNAYRAALAVGYSETSAETITTREWFKEGLKKLRRRELVDLADKKVQEILTYDAKQVTNDGKEKIDTNLLGIQSRTALKVGNYDADKNINLNANINMAMIIKAIKGEQGISSIWFVAFMAFMIPVWAALRSIYGF